MAELIFGDDTIDAVRTKLTHPYSYDPIIIWVGAIEANNTVYTDRLYQWDHVKHDTLCQKHFGNRGQYWGSRTPTQIEAFLRDYLGHPTLALCRITEHCHQATGYPLWRFDYYLEESKDGAGKTAR